MKYLNIEQCNAKNKKFRLSSLLNGIKSVLFSVSAFITAVIFWLTSFFAGERIFASGSLASSKFVTDTQKLLEDATNVLIILAPIVTIFVVGYCFIRKGAADELDHKKWDSRISTAVVSCIGVISASIIVKLIMAYYQ